MAPGLRIESSLSSSDKSSQGIATISVNTLHYLEDENFRPFIGGGLGLYNVAKSYGSFTNVFGFYPRLGFEVGHITASLDYNFVLEKTEQTLPCGTGCTYTETSSSSYVEVRVGGYLFGGKK